MFPVQFPLGARQSLATQPWYEVLGDLYVINVKMQWLTSGECDYPLDNDPKVGRGTGK